MIVECIEAGCFELTDRVSCLCEKHEANINIQCGVIRLFVRLRDSKRKPKPPEHPWNAM